MKSLSVRIDEELLDKLHVVAGYEDRSANGQIIFLIRTCVAEFEAAHEEIVIPPPKKSRKK